MESRAILDSQISASSEYASNYAAQQGRLNFQAGGGLAGGWASRDRDSNQWLQVDLGSTTRVTLIATQGRTDSNQWVKRYKLQYRDDGQQAFTFYRENGHNSDTVRTYNLNQSSIPRTCEFHTWPQLIKRPNVIHWISC